jgi:glutathione peroxidase
MLLQIRSTRLDLAGTSTPIVHVAPGRRRCRAAFVSRIMAQSAVDIQCLSRKLAGMKSLAFVASLLLVQAVVVAAVSSIYNYKIHTLEGKGSSLADYKGKVVLLVNVASKCGYTPQYKALQGLQDKYASKGFTVVGVPCNDFGAQEPGSSEEIRKFCTDNYNVSFPLTEKVHVKGPEQHPLYARLTGEGSEFPGDIKWNFSKFLIGRDGKILQRFESGVKPESPEMTQAIESALASK